MENLIKNKFIVLGDTIQCPDCIDLSLIENNSEKNENQEDNDENKDD